MKKCKCKKSNWFKNNIVIIAILALMVIVLFAQLAKADDKVLFKTANGEATHFNMCDCMAEGFKVFPTTREDILEGICKEKYVKVLMEQSAKEDSIVVASYTSCGEK